ncbi:hypothetical protein PINS_up020195 [Pythium insidiosum]|nr:hypothetical protein PINS_up020195 [Pythium insidiosum]
MLIKALATETSSSTSTLWTLPRALPRSDSALLEELLLELVCHTTQPQHGLLLQKEVNLAVARCCRALLLVTTAPLPARVVRFVVSRTRQLECDANVTIHLAFPFLQALVDFELFAVVNGLGRSVSGRDCGRVVDLDLGRDAWLARLVFERLLELIERQTEERVRADALRLVRRMFVAQAYNPRHQSSEDQELISLLFFPMVATVARFTTDGHLLADSVDDGDDDGVHSGHPPPLPQPLLAHEARKELLVCVAHLLSTVSLPYLSWYFHEPRSGRSSASTSTSTSKRKEIPQELPLSPTAALTHYRRLVEETKRSTAASTSDGRRQSVVVQRRVLAAEAQSRGPPLSRFDEVRVHACLSLVRQIVQLFLVDAADAWQRLLSPELSQSQARGALLELERYRKQQRRSRQRQGSVGSLELLQLPLPRASLSNNGSSSITSSGSSRSPTKAMLVGPTSTSTTSSTVGTRLTTQKSLPRGFHWSKAASANALGRRGSVGDAEDDVAALGLDANVRQVWRIVAETALRALRTAVDQFEWVLQRIEAPLDYRSVAAAAADASVTQDEAFALLGAIVDALFLLLRRASALDCLCSSGRGPGSGVGSSVDDANDAADDEDHKRSFLAQLFGFLDSFLTRFRRALFATRITGLPLIHDQRRIALLVALSTGDLSCRTRRVDDEVEGGDDEEEDSSVHRCGRVGGRSHVAALATAFLCRLALVSFEQTGSLLLVRRPLVRVFSSACFSSSLATTASAVPLASLAAAVDRWRCFAPSADADAGGDADGLAQAFTPQFTRLLDALALQLDVFSRWRDALTRDDAVADVDRLEDDLVAVVQSVSAHWLGDVKAQWLDALVQLHVHRRQFAEAACCKLELVAFTADADVDWQLRELRGARELATQAQWTDCVLEISERLLALTRCHARWTEYQETLRELSTTVSTMASTMGSASAAALPMDAFYRVAIGGQLCGDGVREFVYRRSRFLSLGEFVGEMKASLRASHRRCDRVDVVPEARAWPSFSEHPTTIFVRISSVDAVADDPTLFRFATPCTLGASGSAYGRTAEQLKRVTWLRTPRAFPCSTTRQRVVDRREELRCPVDNAMDDIRKRAGVLRDEIAKESAGRTDLKTLTLVLKGSVDAQVHGGLPEVMDAFLTQFPPLLDATGAVLSVDESAAKRRELVELLVEFLQLCATALHISRAAFRRLAAASHNTNSSSSTSSEGGQVASVSATASATVSTVASTVGTPSPGKTLAPPLPTEDDADDVHVSPLQLEFEKSFATLVALLSTATVDVEHARKSELQALAMWRRGGGHG